MGFTFLSFYMKSLILVFLGGGLGSVLRFVIGKYLNNNPLGIPYGTFAVNILGSFLIGIILGFASKNIAITQSQTLFLATGFCGGFTTFSAFSYENHLFLTSGNFIGFALYSIASFAIGLVVVFLGLYLVTISTS